MTMWADARETLRPGPDARDGQLPPLLIALTVVTGLVDAASFLNLGHVFVANMTGNVVFLGFAIAGASGLSVWASLVALGSFLVGGIAGGRLAGRYGDQRLALLQAALVLQLVAVVGAAVLALRRRRPGSAPARYVVIALLAIAMGIQNATVRRLAVPELTTTVLTMTLTGIGADSTLARRPRLEDRPPRPRRRRDGPRRPDRRAARAPRRHRRPARRGGRRHRAHGARVRDG